MNAVAKLDLAGVIAQIALLLTQRRAKAPPNSAEHNEVNFNPNVPRQARRFYR